MEIYSQSHIRFILRLIILCCLAWGTPPCHGFSMPIRLVRAGLTKASLWIIAILITVLRHMASALQAAPTSGCEPISQQKNGGGAEASGPKDSGGQSGDVKTRRSSPKKKYEPPFPGMYLSPARESIWLYDMEKTGKVPKLAAKDDMEGTGWDLILDARSPAEYKDDHVPGAISTPVLDNSERAVVGTKYKTDRFTARRIGAALISESIAKILRSPVISQLKSNSRVLVICWRGGERSHSLATILARVGFKVGVLKGGYQAYRRRVRVYLEKMKSLKYIVISGPTGSGKTNFLKAIERQGGQMIDIEACAGHKGSILGDSLTTPQPTQKIFEGLLAAKAEEMDIKRPVFIEDEGSRVGIRHLPIELWNTKKLAPRCCLIVPVDFRVRCIRDDYKYFEQKEHMDALCTRLKGLHRRVGKECVDRYLELAKEGSWDELVALLLETHYDKAYAKSAERAKPKNAKNGEGETVYKVSLKSEKDYDPEASMVVQYFQKFIHNNPNLAATAAIGESSGSGANDDDAKKSEED